MKRIAHIKLIIIVITRSCNDLRSQRSEYESSWYWIDPDGRGYDSDVIYVHFNMNPGSNNKKCWKNQFAIEFHKRSCHVMSIHAIYNSKNRRMSSIHQRNEHLDRSLLLLSFHSYDSTNVLERHCNSTTLNIPGGTITVVNHSISGTETTNHFAVVPLNTLEN